jgi:hypothetical protein
MFRSTLNKGFQIKFSNGYEVSVQFGSGNYCSNQNDTMGTMDHLKDQVTESKTAEIAVFDQNHNFVTERIYKLVYNEELYDQVVGYVNADQIADLISIVAKLKG